jgi:hypothetical protein
MSEAADGDRGAAAPTAGGTGAAEVSSSTRYRSAPPMPSTMQWWTRFAVTSREPEV